MKYAFFRTLFILCIVWSLATPEVSLHASASDTVRFNNNNWYTLPHPRVATFSVSTDGSTVGFTENGISFVQYNVPNTYGLRVQRFEIQDHHHYIVDGEIVDSLTEFSVLLAQAYSIHASAV